MRRVNRLTEPQASLFISVSFTPHPPTSSFPIPITSPPHITQHPTQEDGTDISGSAGHSQMCIHPLSVFRVTRTGAAIREMVPRYANSVHETWSHVAGKALISPTRSRRVRNRAGLPGSSRNLAHLEPVRETRNKLLDGNSLNLLDAGPVASSRILEHRHGRRRTVRAANAGPRTPPTAGDLELRRREI